MNFVIRLIPYSFDLMVSIDQTDKQLHTNLKRYGVEWDDSLSMSPTNTGKAVMLPSNHVIVRIKKKHRNKYRVMAVVAHESFHAATFILDQLGFKFMLEVSDEAYAYLLDYIAGEIYKKLRF